MLLFLPALKHLTIFPWPKSRGAGAEAVGRSTAYFPLVGLCLGFILVLLDRLLDPYLASEILSVVLVAVLIVLTRGRHLEGLGVSWDRLCSRGSGADALDAGEHRYLGIFGFLAILVVVAFKFRAIEVMGDARGSGLLLAPVLGRWAMVVLAYGSTPASMGDERTLLEQIRGKQLLISTVIALVLAALFARRLGLWIAFWVSILALLSRPFLHRRLGGVNEGNLGSICEMSETLAMVLFATFLR